jgi:hypothetical protein
MTILGRIRGYYDQLADFSDFEYVVCFEEIADLSQVDLLDCVSARNRIRNRPSQRLHP